MLVFVLLSALEKNILIDSELSMTLKSFSVVENKTKEKENMDRDKWNILRTYILRYGCCQKAVKLNFKNVSRARHARVNIQENWNMKFEYFEGCKINCNVIVLNFYSLEMISTYVFCTLTSIFILCDLMFKSIMTLNSFYFNIKTFSPHQPSSPSSIIRFKAEKIFYGGCVW